MLAWLTRFMIAWQHIRVTSFVHLLNKVAGHSSGEIRTTSAAAATRTPTDHGLSYDLNKSLPEPGYFDSAIPWLAASVLA